MKSLIILFALVLTSGCALLAPPAGTHYVIKYGEIEVEVDDWTDREGVEFEYVKGDTKVILRKNSVDTATPVTALSQKQAENQGAAIGVISELIKR